MSEEKALTPIEQKQVMFYEDEITAVLVEVDEGQEVYVPIRPICEDLGIDWPSQRRRILRDPVLSKYLAGVVITTTPDPVKGGGGPQTTSCLPLSYLNGWLFGINANRVKPELKQDLIRYQEDCYRILAAAFFSPGPVVRTVGDESEQALIQLHNMALVIAATTRELLEVRGMAIEARGLALDSQQRLDAAREYLRGMNQRLSGMDERITIVERYIRAGSLTEEQAREIKKRVNLIAQKYTERDPGTKHYPGVYAALEEETGATSYKRIPPKGYEAAIEFLDNWLKAVTQAETRDEENG